MDSHVGARGIVVAEIVREGVGPRQARHAGRPIARDAMPDTPERRMMGSMAQFPASLTRTSG